ncbi:beta-1,3-galactosyl-O-glycosyl-glycoprotein beta-1,6-N-acetylglucosaminyltransferase 3 [Talpa occidentalis]|uniref:beta-1,3-galactosyl-O-glycosyl-glycoprotein beta-1,6-N-acetylglucosaminyltransferase 3 n=1 Tax=Talpa occidentalis TaxID=50954 RepID=UPI00188F71A9|nr:beta-1,3-galactosyl-O-glycosyl-glycoprotein beta-1,6-N-acetylglucosaminyltransferase 3 [Talpa occidentalis]XP_037358494.1 beta-1,3-galactosyl-O-glycosyl-glycoprotein beta-1,6-N-acetylglucosaminyltransferase 3 [Talpa occidentalis]XP_037358497.1 beta-1,3-galactosyl-O-glycosyl-glycoprotein beta-1,6-N-acetylglucosaminyltransferase 3 [Talpa occidentalis]XP_037358498.1 beta-1,3-galactosyl-O-glycosyl-glycoprotein beta-1,6-N-acetylglucosaminyltransferase 3 [Talpa occidentalis]XP_037358499.1 beta-1,3
MKMIWWKRTSRRHYLWALGCYMLLTIVAVKLSLRLKCDLNSLDLESRDFGSQHCRDILYKSLKLPAKRSINCSRIIQGDQEAVTEAQLDNLEVKKKRAPLTDAVYLNMTRDCEHFKAQRKFIQFPLSKDEFEFPIAYSMVVHEKIENFERLLRAVYAPQNIYCIHVDEKSPETFKEAVKAIVSCFPNVFLASKLVRVVYASWSRVQADLNCMEDLLQSAVPWKYLLNTCGTDFPIKTNAEMVRALKMLNGKNSMESEIPTEYKSSRWKYHYEVTDTLYVTDKEKDPPPENLPMFTGNAYFVASRAFVQHVLENPKSQRLIEWVKDTYSPDEHLWATLQRAPWMPGSVPHHSKFHISDMTAIARLVKWQNHEGDISMGAPYAPCSGIHQRAICIYGAGDLHWMLQNHHLLANKFDPRVDDIALQCLEEYLRHKAIYGTEL